MKVSTNSMNMRIIAKKAARHAKKHKIKILAGTPIAFALFINIQAAGTDDAVLSLTTRGSPFIEVGQTITVNTDVRSPQEVNSFGGEIHFNTTALETHTISNEDSVIDLWAEEPQYSDDQEVISFAGGITERDTYTGTGTLFSFETTTKKTGEYTLTLKNPKILASDGSGINILTGKEDLTLYIRESGAPSPDLNRDGTIGFGDLNTLYFKTFQAYNPDFDLNQDGSVNLGDIRVLIGLL